MSGTVRVRNPSDLRVVINRATLRFRPSGGGEDQTDATECAVRMMAIVHPGGSADVRIRTTLPQTTLPGMYKAVLALGESTYPAELRVVESIDTDITPSQIFVPAIASRVRKTIVVTNNGNVPVTVGSFGGLPLDDELASCRAIRATLKNAPEDTETINQWASLLLRTAGEQLDRLGMLWVGLEGGPLTVEPGRSISADLMIRVPTLPHGSGRFHAVARCYDSAVEFVVVPSGLPSEGAEPPADSTPARAGRANVRRAR
jgi:hypothetical protein